MFAVLLVACLVALPGTAGARAVATELSNVSHPVIYLNLGVHSARLGMTDTKVRTRVGLTRVKSGKDTSYEGQTVYYACFGRKRAGGYDVKTYSNKKHVVWMFEINGSAVRTKQGVHVGSSESSVVSAYGSKVKKTVGDVYTTYTYGAIRGKGTDFYVRNSTHKVTQILVRNW